MNVMLFLALLLPLRVVHVFGVLLFVVAYLVLLLFVDLFVCLFVCLLVCLSLLC